MRSLEIDSYAFLDSPVHAWDPRVKLFCLFLLTCAVVIQESLWTAAGGLLLSIVLVLLSRVPAGFIWKRTRWVLLIFLLFSVLLPFTVPGKTTLLSLPPFFATWEGVELALKITLRGLAAVLIMLVILSTERFDRNIKALEYFRLPNKIIQLFLFAYRYLFVLVEEFHRMHAAAVLRGFREILRMRTLKNVGNMVGMLFVRTLERSVRIHNAMACRGYAGELKTLHRFKTCPGDFLKGLLVLLIAAGLVLCRILSILLVLCLFSFIRDVQGHDPTVYSMEVYTRRLEENPADWEAWRDRGALYRLQGRYDLAEKDLQKALEISPNEPFTLKELAAIALLARQECEECLKLLDRAFESGLKRDDLRDAYSFRWMCHQRLSLKPEILQDLDALIGLGEAPAHLYIERGKIKLSSGNAEEALGDFLEAHRKNPFLLENVERIVDLSFELERKDHALKIAREAVEKNDEEVRFCHILAGVYERFGRKEDAHKERIHALEKAEERVEENPEGCWPLTERARALLSLGRAKEAIEDLNKVIALFPDSESYELRAEAYRVAGDPGRSQADLQEAARFRRMDQFPPQKESPSGEEEEAGNASNQAGSKEPPVEAGSSVSKAGGNSTGAFPSKAGEGESPEKEKGEEAAPRFFGIFLALGFVLLATILLAIVYLLRRR